MSAPDYPRQTDLNPFRERELTVTAEVKRPFSVSQYPDNYSTSIPRKYQIAPSRFASVARLAARTSWTNRLTYSEALDNAAWTKTSLTITADAAIAPDGRLSMDLLTEVAAAAQHKVAQAATPTAAAHVLSAFAVTNGRGFLRLGFVDSAAATFYAYFNLANHRAAAVSAGVTTSVFLMPDGTFRYSAYFTPAAGAGTMAANLSADGVEANISYLGDITKGIYLWGLQFSPVGAFTATSNWGSGSYPYVPTTSVVRTVSSPDVDREDPLAYLTVEGPYTVLHQFACTYPRVFNRIPLDQVTDSSQDLTRPVPSISNGGSVQVAPPQYFFWNPSGSIFYLYILFPAGASTCLYANGVFSSALQTSTSVNSGANTRVTTVAPHGVVGTETICATEGALRFWRFLTGAYTVVDAFNIDLLGVLYGANTTQFGIFQRAFTPGTAPCRTQKTRRFYLAGVTPGITTDADISPGGSLIADSALIAAAIANATGYQNYTTVPKSAYSGPMAEQTLVAINLGDL